LPQVLLTVQSIIQALALEVLWSSMMESLHLWNGGMAALIGWIQVSAVFLGIVVMWIFFISLVFRYTWIPTVSDSVIPFVLGMLEFSFAEMLAPELLPIWFFVLALIFVGASATSGVILKRALADEANREMREAFDYSSNKAIRLASLLIGTLVVAGLAVAISGPGGWVALGGVIAANVVLLAQAHSIRGYWNRSLVEDWDPES
jgi:hypothetical protein